MILTYQKRKNTKVHKMLSPIGIVHKFGFLTTSVT